MLTTSVIFLKEQFMAAIKYILSIIFHYLNYEFNWEKILNNFNLYHPNALSL